MLCGLFECYLVWFARAFGGVSVRGCWWLLMRLFMGFEVFFLRCLLLDQRVCCFSLLKCVGVLCLVVSLV